MRKKSRVSKSRNSSDGRIDNVIRNAIANAEKKFGSGLLGLMSNIGVQDWSNGFSFGLPSLNFIVTNNPRVGIPRGKIFEIFGSESSGKTTLCVQTVRELQHGGGVAAYIDAEHDLDLSYASSLGVDIDRLLFAQPECGEETATLIENLIASGVDLIIIDSIAAMLPKSILEGSYDKIQPGAHARLMARCFARFKVKKNDVKTSILCTNQERSKIGVLFGNPTTTTGGKALKFYANARIETTLSTAAAKSIRGAAYTLTGTKDRQRLGSIGKFTVRKNKLGPPFRNTEVPFVYGLGFDGTQDLYSLAADAGLITAKRGGKYDLGNGTVTLSEMDDARNIKAVWKLLDAADLTKLAGFKKKSAVENQDEEEMEGEE